MKNLSVCLFHSDKENGAADIHKLGSKMQLIKFLRAQGGFGNFRTNFGFFTSEKHLPQPKGREKFFCTIFEQKFFFSYLHVLCKKKKFQSIFRDFLDFCFGRYGPKSDGKKSIFKKFLKIEELSCETDSGLILQIELRDFREKIFQNFWVVGWTLAGGQSRRKHVFSKTLKIF